MKVKTNPKDLIWVPFSKTECGVDFNINTDSEQRLRGVLMKHAVFRTDFFEVFFFEKASGFLRYGSQHVSLRDNMVLILSPHIQQEWHIDEETAKYRFLIFHEEFLNTYLADPFFTYRLLYCHQTELPPSLTMTEDNHQEYERLLLRLHKELEHPLADSYHIIVSILHYLLMILNRHYSVEYNLPFDPPKNYHAFQFKNLLDKHIREYQKVSDYADMLKISRISLNTSVQAQYGQTASHLLKKRLLAEVKNDLLFTEKNVNELAYEFHFSEPNHLMRFFKKQTNMTISEFRKNFLQNGN